VTSAPPVRSLRTVKPLIAIASLLFVVGAAAPGEVAPAVAQNGYVIETGADATDAVVGRAVSDARSAGSLFYVVVLADEPPSGATTFADGVLDRVPRSEGTVLVVAPETVGWASDNDATWTSDELDAALEASLDGATSDDVVAIFVSELMQPSSGGGVSGWILLAIVLLVGAGIIVLVVRGSRRRTATRARTLADLRSKAQAQIDDIANDILDLEDEVEESSDGEVRRHFDEATDIYTTASERLGSAADAQAIVAIGTELDTAIWHLDCAEAILDGKPVPPEPAPPHRTPPAPSPASPGGPPSGPGSAVPPLPDYQRRSTRRSGFGADDMLKTVLAMQALRTLGGGSRRTGWGGGGSRSGGGSRGGGSSAGRSRGGGRRRG
jgi:Family of unknown function (DUF6676)